MSHEEVVDRILDRGGAAVLIGGIDTGKTSFGLALASAGAARGMKVAVVDADIGQSTIGPPTCVGLKFAEGDTSGLDWGSADDLGFVGSPTPEGHLLPLVSSTRRLVDHAREAGAELIVVDTTGYVSGFHAEMLKYHKLDLIRPNFVVGFHRGEELAPILGVVSRFFMTEVATLRVMPQVVERTAEERLARREERLRSYFQPPLSRWRIKPTVFMPAIPPETDLSRLDGILVGLEDGNGVCPGIGLLEYQSEDDQLRLVSSAAEGANGLRLGSIRVTSDGRIIERFVLRELIGR